MVPTERDALSSTIRMLVPDPSRRNRITTAKYTWYTFVPKNLFEQLTQLANAYFLLIALLQVIPEISNTGGYPLTLIPLSFVLVMGAIKDGFEDWRRHVSDRSENEGEAVAMDEGQRERRLRWHEVRPGMVLRVREGERLAADGLLLGSSDPEGHCYVETASLDGESNLKKKTRAPAVAEIGIEQVLRTPVELECEPPSVDLYQFRGAVAVAGGKPVGASIGNLLLRGTSVQRTAWVLCLVVYCGHDTRVMQNAKGAVFKTSSLDKKLQKVMMLIFSVQMCLCITLSVGNAFSHMGLTPWYLRPAPSYHPSYQLIVHWATWSVQTNALVPCSLMVTLMSVKFVQGMFLSSDYCCGDVDSGKGAKVKTSQVIDTLGQVTHVFSDKTGTLTQNVMEYKACSVGGRTYGLRSEGPGVEPLAAPRTLRCHGVNFEAGAFYRDLTSASDPERSGKLALFLLGHALCHSVEGAHADGAAAGGEDEDEARGAAPYNASSPDELALVGAARAVGVEFVRATETSMQLEVRDPAVAAAVGRACGWRAGSSGGSLGIPLLDTCEFDNDRKRMSVIVRYPDGRAVLLVKGADTSVLPHVGADAARGCEAHLGAFARRGLRTLCFATRELGAAELEAWRGAYAAAKATLSDDRADRIQACAEELETRPGLRLLGATAIEDQLQSEVPEVLQQVQEAGIRVWVLTGDKVETAISIAKSCRLLTEDMTQILLEGDGPDHEELLRHALECPRPALVISGAALRSLLLEATACGELRRLLLEAAQRCCTVVCCRVSPKQKADVVGLVKSQVRSAVTLSIGDGANDVSMIVTAHVGVGLTGKEGAQAALSADFSIAEFRFLRRLLFVHGRESYRRSSVLTLYNFYKNWLLILPTILYATVSGYSGQNLFAPWLVQTYNIAFTHLPVCFYGILDQAVGDLRQLEHDPREYAPSLFGVAHSAAWLLAALSQALLLCAILRYAMAGRAGESGSDLTDLFAFGAVGFVWVVTGANITLVFRHSAWLGWVTWAPYLFNMGCMLGVYCFFRNFGRVFATPDDFLRLLLATVFAMVGHTCIGEAIIRSSCRAERAIASRGALLRRLGLDRPGARAWRRPSPLAHPLAGEASPGVDSMSYLNGSSVELGLLHSSNTSSFGYAFSEDCARQRDAGRARRPGSAPPGFLGGAPSLARAARHSGAADGVAAAPQVTSAEDVGER